ncbi:glycoside hydrolase family 5 protein [Hydnum rufescens UP504]|uniref:Glycoside hydrolase family 5 protein n=1 Tax=Hydnum rufescens UP504 TaxID=1448309 RepID=A0A9P6AUP9_9AGAM|nr:glycoside hydrolase family 5 protein [Hydnum rufescens UP504]
MLFLAFFLTFFFAAVCADNFAAGSSRFLGTTRKPETIFSIKKFESTVGAIIDTIGLGNNRSYDHSVPVPKIYGVNIGGWLLSEAWMFPSKWLAMGGQFCSSCDLCRQSEWSLAEYLGREQTNAVFKEHWETWFTQEDVDGIVAAGLNMVRIPMGFWIIEDIVDTATEPYAQGALDQLIRGLTMLRDAGIYVVLDQHAMPGVSSINQMFAGNCTPTIQFYESPNDYNYKRAVTWSIVMTYLSHMHPAFKTVFSLEAINEPEMNYAITPGLDRYEKSFVLGVRVIEFALGIICDDSLAFEAFFDPITAPALFAAIPIIRRLNSKYNIGGDGIETVLSFLLQLCSGKGVAEVQLGLNIDLCSSRCLSTQFMNRDWQHLANGTVPNPADAARGPQIYDNHLYFNFGGVAAQNPTAYMQVICNLTRVADAAAISNAPLYFGEWAISTAFATNDTFLKMWGDAQKQAYSQGAGWSFWAWKVDPDATVLDQRMWSYRDAIAGGVMTKKPDEYFTPDVCAPFR